MKLINSQRTAVLIIAAVIFILSQGMALALINGMTSLDSDPLHQLPATTGKISYFSSKDVTGSCDGAAWGELLGEDCGSDDATKYWYVAMRWPYVNGASETEILAAKSWWHDKKILVTNPTNNKQVILAVKDWGPNEDTGRVIDVSKAALDYLGAVTDNTVNIAFADQDLSLGPSTLSTSIFGIPTSGTVTTSFLKEIDYESSGSYYDENNDPKSSSNGFHHGVDIAGGGTIENTEPVYAAGSGKVVYVGYDSGYGNYVVVYHGYNVNGNGKYTYSFYSHMGNKATGDSFITASVGQQISDGILTPIGRQGNSGYTLGATGIHLDFEVRLSDTELKDNPDGTWSTNHRSETIAADPKFYTGVDLPYGKKVTASAPSVKKIYWEFNTPGDKEGWELHNIGASSVTAGVLRIDPNPEDYWIESQPIAVNANNYNAIEINIASNAPDGVGAIYFKTSDSNSYTEDKKVEFSVNPDGKFKDYSLSMGGNPNWKGTITGIRIDPSNTGTSDNKDIGFDYIKFSNSNPSSYAPLDLIFVMIQREVWGTTLTL
jgi:murein DD-endopeptidase MepM/ murein hydrolase activator NlpD